jgi:hypothetical protein
MSFTTRKQRDALRAMAEDRDPGFKTPAAEAMTRRALENRHLVIPGTNVVTVEGHAVLARSIRYANWPDEEKATLTALWGEGMLSKAIADQMGRTKHQIDHQASAMGLPRRHMGFGVGRDGKVIRISVPADVYAFLASRAKDRRTTVSGYVRYLCYRDTNFSIKAPPKKKGGKRNADLSNAVEAGVRADPPKAVG